MRRYLPIGMLVVFAQTACDGEPKLDRGIDVFIEESAILVDLTYPQEQAAVTLNVSFAARDLVDNEAVVLNSAGLYMADNGLGEAVADLNCAFPDDFDSSDPLGYPVGTIELLCDATNSQLADACGQEFTVGVAVQSAACDCERSAVVKTTVECLPDNRADALAAVESAGTPANKPSQLQIFIGSEEGELSDRSLYGYDDEGRLLFIDEESVEFVEEQPIFSYSGRRLFTYLDNGYYESSVSIVGDGEGEGFRVETRSAFSYDAEDRLVQIDVDGGGVPDGVIDHSSAISYSADGTVWTVLVDEDNDGTTDSTRTYTYDEALLAIELVNEPAAAGTTRTTFVLSEAVDHPNQVLLQELAESGLQLVSISLDDSNDGEADAIKAFFYEAGLISGSELRDADSDLLVVREHWIYEASANR